MPSLISEKYNDKDVGLYRENGLGVVKNKSESETKKNKEKHIKDI